jgi:anti-sigma factor ChrR (cupin superfamily)
MRHDEPTDEIRERAALHALGVLEAEEARAFEAHLAAGCAVCLAEVRAFADVAGELALLAGETAPPPSLREKLMAGLDRPSEPAGGYSASSRPVQVWKEWRSDRSDPWFLLRAGEGEWAETGVRGVSVRRLFVDTARQTTTMMVRMAPGTSYPSHRHADAEECFVLEGDLHVGDTVMHAGDYQRVEASSVHGVQSTEGGCTLLIVSSLHDEILE